MNPERFQIVVVDGYGYGIMRKQHAHYAEVEVHDGRTAWNMVVQNDEFEIVEEISVGREELR